MSKEIIENIQKSKSDPISYRYITLQNGLKCLLGYDPEIEKCAAAMNVGIGYFVDPPAYPGLAHFIEHMLFMGTKKYPKESEFFNYINKLGGRANAFTSCSNTSFYFDASAKDFHQALDKFAQFFIAPLFNEDGISREVNAIDQEHKTNYLNDTWRFNQLKLSQCNQKSVLSKFSTGNKETLNKPGIRDEMVKLYKKFYAPEIMDLCIISNKPNDEMQKVIEELFGQVPKNPNFVKPVYDDVNPFEKGESIGLFYKVLPINDRDNIEISWLVENQTPYFKEKPLTFIAGIFDCQGQNSLTSSLIKDDLISDLSCAENTIAMCFTKLTISVTLTKKGLSQYKHVIYRILKFVKIIQSQKINDRFCQEIFSTLRLSFDYQSKENPIDLANFLSTRMQKYSAEYVIVADNVVMEYNSELTEKFLHQLKFDNMNIYLISKSVESECNQKEKWYDTKFSKVPLREEISEEEIDKCVCEHSLGYPPPNKFIPTNFDLVKFDEKEDSHIPVNVYNDEMCTIYFKKDDTFKLPEGFCEGIISLNWNTSNLSNKEKEILNLLLDDIISEELRETVYMANEARLTFAFTPKMGKIFLTISGFSSSILNSIKEIIEKFNQINFENKKDKLKEYISNNIQVFQNFYLRKGFDVVFRYLSQFMTEPSIVQSEISESLKRNPPTVEEIEAYLRSMFTKIKCEWLIFGNFDKKEAIEIGNYFHKNLKYKPSPLEVSDASSYRSVNINPYSNYVYTFRNPAKEEPTSSIISFFQFGGNLSLRDRAKVKIIEAIIKDKFFEELRTKQSLGYVVMLFAREFRGNEGITMIVQSSSEVPEVIWRKMNEFLVFAKEKIFDTLTDDVLKTYVQSVLIGEKKKFISLREEMVEYYNEVYMHRFDFERKKKFCDVLENGKITKEEICDMFKENMLSNVKRLDIEYLCQEHVEKNENALKENIEAVSKEGKLKRLRVESIHKFQAKNGLFPDFFSIGMK